MASVTASLLGTSSYSLYGLTASYALNVSGTWNSSSYTSPSQSVAGFGVDGRTILYTPTQDNLYLAKRGNTISWVPIETKFSAVYLVDEQQSLDVVSQSMNYGAALGIDTTEEVQSVTSRLKELNKFVDKEIFDFQQIAMSLSRSVITLFSAGESLDRQDPVINKSGSMISANQFIETLEYGDLFANKTGSMVSSNIFVETMEYGHFFANTTGSMVSSNVFVETMEYGHFFTNKTGSMVSSTQLTDTIEYVDSIIYITGSMQPIFTATPFTTASI